MWSPWRGAVAGLIAGAAATAGLAVAGGRSTPARGTDRAAAYIDEWRQSQLATWAVVLRWERRAGGGRLEDDVRIAQRPPDRLATGAGSVDARRGDRRLACAAGEDGRLRCRDAGPAPPYDAQVAQGVAVLRSQLAGPGRLYDVVGRGAHCYELRLRVRYPVPPYGRRAEFCFDPATHAPTLLDVERAEGRDRQQAIAVSGRVDDTELAPPVAG